MEGRLSNLSQIMDSDRTKSSSSYTGPGDIVSSAKGWWGLRAYTAAVAATGTQKAITISDGGGANSADILILTTGSLDAATLDAWIIAHGTAHVDKAWDQSGNGNHLTKSGTNRPTMVASGIGSRYAMAFAAASSQELLNAGTTLTASGLPFSQMTVCNRTGSTSSQGDVFALNATGIGIIGYTSSANTLEMYDGAVANITGGAADNTWLAFQGMFNGASSKAYVNGTATNSLDTGGGGNIGANPTIRWGENGFGQFLDGKSVEIGYWNGDISGTFATMNSNIRAYWGF